MVTKVQSSNVSQSPAVPNLISSTPAKRTAGSAMPATADVVSNDGRAVLQVVGEAARATGANPFESMVAGALDTPAPVLRLALANDATSESCEPTLQLLSVVSTLEGRAAARENYGPSRVRNGMMQVTYDAQEERAANHNVSREGSEVLAKQLVDRPAKTEPTSVLHAQEWRSAMGTYYQGGDVNAFVQQVLRECYLLGNLDLEMYAEKVKAMNELRKAIRKEADRARQVMAAWKEAAHGDENWASSQGYETVKVDGIELAMVPGNYTDAEEGKNAEGKLQDVGSPGDAPSGEATVKDPFFDDTSTLKPEMRSNLEYIKKFPSDTIQKDKIGEIEQYLGSMNAKDVEKYLLPLLDKLYEGGHTGTMLGIMEKLSPKQLLVVIAHGYGSTGKDQLDQLSVEETERLVKAQRNAVLQLFGDEVSTDTYGKGVTAEEAKGWLNRLNPPPSEPKRKSNTRITRDREGLASDRLSRQRLEPAAGGLTAGGGHAVEGQDAPAPGYAINTIEKMDSYIKYLEEQMNGVGDDAQLANIDLQNCLQKQQQTLQMMSNISKMMHEVAMSIIRNLNS